MSGIRLNPISLKKENIDGTRVRILSIIDDKEMFIIDLSDIDVFDSTGLGLLFDIRKSYNVKKLRKFNFLTLIDSDIAHKAFRKNWARLIQKIYHVNPLLCPKCLGSMKIISFPI
ncbi:unnamed protein product [marine sediment metagenome]|uniref:STAS domain-containing protein n=1 Tax=marine sediment metagenome TaxID=412755 RepID=X0Z3X1_9ZZZZ